MAGWSDAGYCGTARLTIPTARDEAAARNVWGEWTSTDEFMMLCGRAGDAAEGKLPRSMTAHEMAGGDLFLYRRLLPADGLRIPAPGMEMATRRPIGGRGHF